MVSHAFNTFSFQQSSPNQFAGPAQQVVAHVLPRNGRRLCRALEHSLSRSHINVEREYRIGSRRISCLSMHPTAVQQSFGYGVAAGQLGNGDKPRHRNAHNGSPLRGDGLRFQQQRIEREQRCHLYSAVYPSVTASDRREPDQLVFHRGPRKRESFPSNAQCQQYGRRYPDVVIQ